MLSLTNTSQEAEIILYFVAEAKKQCCNQMISALSAHSSLVKRHQVNPMTGRRMGGGA